MHQAGDKLAQIAHSALTPPLPQLATNEGLTLPAPPADERRRASLSERRAALRPLVICEGLTWDVLARCDLVITKSGTATLEAMILQKPMVIVYRGSALMALEWRLRRRSLNIAHIGLPNILAGERLFAGTDSGRSDAGSHCGSGCGNAASAGAYSELKERLADLVRDNLGEPGGVAPRR